MKKRQHHPLRGGLSFLLRGGRKPGSTVLPEGKLVVVDTLRRGRFLDKERMEVGEKPNRLTRIGNMADDQPGKGFQYPTADGETAEGQLQHLFNLVPSASMPAGIGFGNESNQHIIIKHKNLKNCAFVLDITAHMLYNKGR